MNLWLILSRGSDDAELNYSHLEKEAFAMVWACKTNHIYVYGRPFKLITDALAVKKIFEEDKIRKRIPIRFIRWKSDLSVYNVTFVHREGAKNIADYLSRRFASSMKNSNITTLATKMMEETINNIVVDCLPTSITLPELLLETNNDDQLKLIVKCLRTNKDAKQMGINKWYRNIWNELSISSQGIVLKGDVIVLPPSLYQKTIDHAHEGHGGMSLCKRLLKNICWFPKLDTLVNNTIKDCAPCQCNEDNTTNEPIIASLMPTTSWHTIDIDFSSRSPTNEYQLATYDEHSRKSIVKLAKDLTSATAIQICKNLFTKYGIPKVIKSDNGPAFISKEWANFAKKYNFKHQKITPLHPKANPMAERVMKTSNKRIRCSVVAKTPWKAEMSNYLKRYNQTPHSATGYSPNMLLLGSDQCDILPNIHEKMLTADITERAQENDAKAKALMKKYADQSQHTRHRDFKVNDPILHKWDRSTKHLPLFDPSPYRVAIKKGTMITAQRPNHTVTRNSSKFKHITESCYSKLLELAKLKKSIPLNQVYFPQQELHLFRPNTMRIPETPASLVGSQRVPSPSPSSKPRIAPRQINNNAKAAAMTNQQSPQPPSAAPPNSQAKQLNIERAAHAPTSPHTTSQLSRPPRLPKPQTNTAQLINEEAGPEPNTSAPQSPRVATPPPINVERAAHAPTPPPIDQRRSSRLSKINPVDYAAQSRLNKKKPPKN